MKYVMAAAGLGLLILVVSACGGEKEKSDPVALASTPAPMLSPTPAATSAPTVTPGPTLTATPENRWGIYVTSKADDAFPSLETWEAVVPGLWRNPQEEWARYEVSIVGTTRLVESCAYSDSAVVDRMRFNVYVAITDLETGKNFQPHTFEGGDPDPCSPAHVFYGGSKHDTVEGDVPDVSAFERWFLATLPVEPAGLVTLTPSPTPTIIAAQGYPTQTYSVPDDPLVFTFPARWTLSPPGGRRELTGAPVDNAVTDTVNVQVAGPMTLDRLRTSGINFNDAVPTEVVEGLAAVYWSSGGGSHTAAVSITLGGRASARIDGRLDANDVLLIALDMGDGSFVLVSALCGTGHLPDFEQALLALASSITVGK